MKFVFFVPACGLGTRVASLGQKPFLMIDQQMALERVLEMAPIGVEIEVMLRRSMGCPPLRYNATVHFVEKTDSQADTIRRWLIGTRREEYAIISNCDNEVDTGSIDNAISWLEKTNQAGVVFTFQPVEDGDKRFSYVLPKKSRTPHVVEGVFEHDPVSRLACAGVYILKISMLRDHLSATDEYLSQALNRIAKLQGTVLRYWPVQRYAGWNDLGQIAELSTGKPQHKGK